MTLPATDVKARKAQIRPALDVAIRALVHEGLTITAAAEKAGLTREGLSKALKKPHVQGHLTSVRRARHDAETFRAWGGVFDLAQNATSEDVRLKACRLVIEAAGELDLAKSQPAPSGAASVTVVINSKYLDDAALQRSDRGVIEAAPYTPGGADV